MAAHIPNTLDVATLDLTNPEHITLIQTLHQQHQHLLQQTTEQQQQITALGNRATELEDRLQQPQQQQRQAQAERARAEADAFRVQIQSTEHLSATLEKLGDHLTTSSTTTSVPIFGGKPKDLRRWVEEIEKHVRINRKGDMRGVDQDLKLAAYRFSTNAVSEYIQQRLHLNQGWDVFVDELHNKFGEKLDQQTRLVKLREFTQRGSQSIQIFSEALYKKAREVYGREIETNFAQKELIAIFAKGIAVKSIGKKVLNEFPSTFSAATELAVNLEEKQYRLQAHGFARDEPMDISEVNKPKSWIPKKDQPKNKQQNGKPGHTYKWEGNQPVCFDVIR
jgi:hypothetical protein